MKQRPNLVNSHTIKGVMDIEWTRCLTKLNQVNKSVAINNYYTIILVFIFGQFF